MEELLEWLEFMEDSRQVKKVKHEPKDIIIIVLFASLAKSDDFTYMEYFPVQNEDFLKKYIKLENGVPSHDTINGYLWKTMRGNKQNDLSPSHVVSAWSKEDGFCLCQKVVKEKCNEITAIPEPLDKIQIKNQVITIDAMGTQKETAEKIKIKRADYVLALK